MEFYTGSFRFWLCIDFGSGWSRIRSDSVWYNQILFYVSSLRTWRILKLFHQIFFFLITYIKQNQRKNKRVRISNGSIINIVKKKKDFLYSLVCQKKYIYQKQKQVITKKGHIRKVEPSDLLGCFSFNKWEYSFLS